MANRRPAQPHNPDKTQSSFAASTVVVGVRKVFAAETGNYFFLLGTTLFLVTFGLVMVLSSSAIESHVENDSFFAAFEKQGLYALIGIPIMLMASRFPITFWKKWAWPAVLFGMSLQLLVFSPLGYEYGGNRNWINFGLFTAQPSELVKLTLILWIAVIITSKSHLLNDWKHVALPIGPVAAVAIGLVLIGNDLGTAVIMVMIVFGSLFFAEVRLKFLTIAAAVLGALGLLMAFASSSRTDRINAWLNGCDESNYMVHCWQPMHGTWALASGGVFGVGLGGSKAKWNWLPEADNDYIFAIIGEELGLVGAIVVIALFIVLAVSFMRIIRTHPDPFARIVTSGVMVWIVGQAFVNIAVVLGALPVLGVPLPLISAGGSALLSTLLAIGVVLSFARGAPTSRSTPVAQTPAERSRMLAAQRSGKSQTQPGARRP
ncbi:MAG: putative lipid II flippase FtsW [Microbacteriaceae bacterium]